MTTTKRDPILDTIESYRALNVLDGDAWHGGERHARALERRRRGGELERAAGESVGDSRRAKAWERIAVGALASVTAYVCPAIPVRPASLADDDDDLRGALRAASRARKRSQPDKRLLADFGAWRAAVWAVEETAVGNVQVVTYAVLAFRAVGDNEAARALLAFLREEYAHDPDRHPLPEHVLDVPRFAARVARARFASVLPPGLAEYLD